MELSNKLRIFDVRQKKVQYLFIRLNNDPFQSTCFGLIQGDSEMTHVVIYNCSLICKKICKELSSNGFNVTIAMGKYYSTDHKKVARFITIRGL